MNEKNFSFLKHLLLIIICTFLLTSCCCDDDDNSPAPPPTLIKTGSFVDSPVEGLHFKTESQDGITGINGSFSYYEGETITFSICPTSTQKSGAEVILGQNVPVKNQMSPVDLVPSASSDLDPIRNRVVTNISRLIQSLDNDGDLSNGILLSDAVRNEVAGRTLLFDQSTADFSQDNEIIALFHRLNTMDPDPFSDLGDRQLATPTQAQTHLRESIYGKIKEIVITPKAPYENLVTPEIAIGLEVAFKAYAHYEEPGRDPRDITRIVTWASSDSFISDFTNNFDTDGYVIFNAKNPGTAKINSILDGEIGRINLHITPPELQRIDVYPDIFEMAKGEILQFQAIGSFSNGYTENITDKVVWDSSDTSFAFFSHNLNEKGLIEAVLPGTTKISAAFDGITGYADLGVVNATLKHIEVIPINENYPKGVSIQFTAKGRFSDGDLKDVTNQVQWVSYNPLVASVSTNGIVRAENVGKTRIKAIHRVKQDIIGSTEIIVDPAIAVSVNILPKNIVIAKGDPKQFTAIATYSDEKTKDVTSEIQWESSNTSVAIIDTKGLLSTNHSQTFNYPIKIQLNAILDKITGSIEVTIDEAAPKTVKIYPESIDIAKGDAVGFTAVVHYTDGKTETLFPVDWWKHDTNTLGTSAFFSTPVNAYSISTDANTELGTANVQVVIDEGPYKGEVFTSKLTVKKKVLRRILVSLKDCPDTEAASGAESYTFPFGMTPQLQARGIYSDSTSTTLTTKAAWSSSVTQVATVNNDNFKGLIDTYQKSLGQTIIRAMYENVIQPLKLNVIEPVLTKIEMYPANFTLPVDEEQIFTAIGVYTDKSKDFITSQLSWTSDNKIIAKFSEDSRIGVLIGMNQGIINVNASGKTKSLDGKAKTIDIVKTTSVEVIDKKPVSLSILPEMPVLPLGRTQKFTATVKYSDNSTADVTNSVSWSSSVTQTARIDNNGFAQTYSDLTPTVIYASIYGMSDFTKITVVEHVLDKIDISKEEDKETPVSQISVSFGDIQYLRALGTYSDYTIKGKQIEDITTEVHWSTADPNIATIDTSIFGCKGMQVGETSLSASLSGLTSTIKVNITKANFSSISVVPSDTFVSVGNTKQFQAIGSWDDGYTQNITHLATWSNNEALAISNGAITSTSLSPQNIEITASYSNKSGNAQLTVYPSDLIAIDIDSQYSTLAKGRGMPLTATLKFADLTSKPGNAVKWTTSTPDLIEISNGGSITAVSPGNAMIEASIHGVTGRIEIQILDRVLDNIVLFTSPEGNTFSVDQVIHFSAIGTYSDAYTENITTKAVWHSSKSEVANAGNSIGFKGVVTSKTVGFTTISATYLGVTRTMALSVFKKGLRTIDIFPPYPKIPAGHSLQFTAIGIWDDGYTQNITHQATWSVSENSIAQFSSDTEGLINALLKGTTTITATITATLIDSLSDSSGETILEVPSVMTGQFKDSNVQGLNYETLTQRGTTNSNGEFTYLDGEKITFSIKNLVLGSGLAKPVMTPIDLVNDAYDYNHPKVVTLCRFLQSIDNNGYPDDGILISPAIANVIENRSINFDNIAQFENDMDQLLSDLKNLFTANQERTLTSIDDAKNHLRETVFGTLDRIDVVADSLSVPLGKIRTFSAIAVFSKGYTLDVTQGVVWTASEENWVILNQNGDVKPLSNIGQVNIIASYDDYSGVMTGEATLTITDAVPDYIVIKQVPILNEGQAIPLGDSVQMSATVFYSDGLARPEGNHTFIWDIADKTVATVNTDGKVTAAKAFGKYTQTTLTAKLQSMEDVHGNLKITIKDKILKDIEISPKDFNIPNGKEKMFKVTGIFSNGDHLALTEVTVHSESDTLTTRFETSDDYIYVKALSEIIPYSANIKVTYNEFESIISLVITAPEPEFIVISPLESNLPLGDTVSLSATVYYSDGSSNKTDTVNWKTEKVSVATVNTNGVVLAVNNFPPDTRTTKITATFEKNGKTITRDAIITLTDAVLESIEISPETASLANGDNMLMSAVGTYSNGYTKTLTSSDNINWQSSHPAVTKINSGNVTVNSDIYPITVTITASSGKISGISKISITKPRLIVIGVVPANKSIHKGNFVIYTATGYYSDQSTSDLTDDVTWQSSNVNIATFDENTIKTDRFSNIGTLIITAVAPDGLTNSTKLSVKTEELLAIEIKGTQSIPKGLTVQFTAIGSYSDYSSKTITNDVQWSCDQPGKIVFDSNNKGLAVAGTNTTANVLITATSNDGIEGTFNLLVTDAVLRWINILPENPVLPEGINQNFVAMGTYSDLRNYDISNLVNWSSTNPDVAIIESKTGIATALSANLLTQTSISAHFNSITGTTRLTVNEAQLVAISITTDISITNATIPKGTMIQFYAKGMYSDGEERDLNNQAGLTWSSTNGSIINIDAKTGRAVAIESSQDQIFVAALLGNKFNQFPIKVSAAKLISIDITPKTETIHKGQTLQFFATGEYTDGSMLDITNQASWNSSDNNIASFITFSKKGLVTAINSSQTPTIISATFDNIKADTFLTIDPEILESIWIMPVAPLMWTNPAQVSEGYTLSLQATGIMTDKSLDQNLAVQWSSNDSQIADFSDPDQGILTGIKEGTVDVIATATQNSSITLCFSVSVIPHVLESIEIVANADLPGFDPKAPSVPIGYTQFTFTAYGTYNDKLIENLTSQVSWSAEIGNQPTEIIVIEPTGSARVQQPGEITQATKFSIYAIFDDNKVGTIELEIIP